MPNLNVNELSIILGELIDTIGMSLLIKVDIFATKCAYLFII